MTPRVDGNLAARGIVGADLDVRQAAGLARIAAANALAAVAACAGGLDDVVCLQLTVYVACAPHFDGQTQVADGASAELSDRLGARGVAARTAIGVTSLPSGAPVEVSLVAARPASAGIPPT